MELCSGMPDCDYRDDPVFLDAFHFLDFHLLFRGLDQIHFLFFVSDFHLLFRKIEQLDFSEATVVHIGGKRDGSEGDDGEDELSHFDFPFLWF